MSAEWRRYLVLAGLAVAGAIAARPAAADDEGEPDVEFLLYLGSWEDTDEEWTMFVEDTDDEAEAEAPDAQAARTEKDDDDET